MTDAKKIIGFIGLGHMGQPMAWNLIKAGYSLKIYDVFEEAVKPLVALGAVGVRSPLEILDNVDYVISMLPEGSHVKSVYLGENGLLAHANKSTVFMECSTIDMSSVKLLHEEAKKQNIAIIDAPVSGGTLGAKNAALTFMVGGKADILEKVKPILLTMGKKVFHAGKEGAGQAAKICNNMMLGVSMIAVCEGFNLGKKLGLDTQALFDICSNASSQCWSMTSYCPVPGPVPASPANNHYEPGFMAKMMLKDLKLAQDAANSLHLSTPLGNHAEELYQRFCESGHAEKDFSGIINMLLEEKN